MRYPLPNDNELTFTYIRSPGPGGQNVNKVATGVVLRFNVVTSISLNENVRARLLLLLKNKLTRTGELIIKSTRFRTQERNKQDALLRLEKLIIQASTPIKKRKKTKPTHTSVEKRLAKKKSHAKTKSLRRKNFAEE